MSDLGTQLRDYLDKTAPPVEFEEVIALIEGRSPDSVPAVVVPPPRRRVWLVGVAAFAIVILVLGGLGLLFGNGGGADPATPTTVAPVSPPTVDSPEPSAPETSPEPSAPENSLIPGGPESVSHVATFSTSEEFNAREAAVSYLDADTWRLEVTEGGNRQLFIRDGTDMFVYSALPNTFTIVDLTNECPIPHTADDVSEGCAERFYVAIDPIADGSYPFPAIYFVCDEEGTCVGPGSGGTAWEDCSVEAGGLVAGLETNYYVCERDLSLDGGPTQTQTLELWMGADSTTLKWIWTEPQSPEDLTPGDETVTAYEVAEIDQAPSFDPSLFEFECPTDNCANTADGPDPTSHSMVGQPAPETSGNLLTGEPFDLSDLTGEKVIVNLGASWCPPCADGLAELQTLQDERKDIVVITILPSDDPGTAQRFLDDNNIQLLAIDPIQDNNTVLRQWQTSSYPSTYLIDETGIIVAVFIGILDQVQLDQLLNNLNW